MSETTTQSPSTSSSSSTLSSSHETRQNSMSYEEFRKRKESSRVTTLPLASSKPKKLKSGKSKGKSTDKVKIQVGIKEFHELDYALKILKGRSLPVAVNACINAKGLLQEALTKHSKHFRSFNGNINEYVLLYPDNTVVNLLPGSSQFFSLEDYKEDLGKPYSKMSLHLCKLECLLKSEAESKCDDDLAELEEDTVNFTSHGQGDSVYEISSVNVPSNTQSIMPFLCNADALADASAAVNSPSLEHKVVKATCPTCYLDFSISEIETHADVCAEQFDPVGTVNIEVESAIPDDQGEIEIEQVSTIDNGSVSTSKIEKIKEVVSNLHQYVDMENFNRVSIRRRYVYQDYLAAVARQKKRRRFIENSMLKVTFIGEPAVDDGGPRREFFSGTYNNIYCRDETFDCETKQMVSMNDGAVPTLQ